ncbi:MAG: hypothetical protein M9907_06165 [Burkholderiaceae bacterium]|nr:hypothetical protein [Burkholderiaceae bacterium]
MTPEEAFARFAAARGFDLRAFDAFIAQIAPGDDRDAFAEARAEGVEAMAQGNEDWARRCLLWMLAANRLWLADPKARIGHRRQKQVAAFSVKGAKERAVYTEAQRTGWRTKAAAMSSLLSARGKAALIARRERLPDAAVETIRREIAKVGKPLG